MSDKLKEFTKKALESYMVCCICYRHGYLAYFAFRAEGLNYMSMICMHLVQIEEELMKGGLHLLALQITVRAHPLTRV